MVIRSILEMVLVAFVNTIEKRWNREGFNDGGGEELE